VRLTILHTNDIHGRQERIGQIATLVRAAKASADHPVLYLDAGDVEDTTNRLSNVTKGVAMHRLMNRARCDAATVGNACWLRYGPGILAEHARAARYPLLLANFAPVTGPVASTLLGDVGVFGLTAPFRDLFGDVEWGFEPLHELDVARRTSAELRAQGASLIVFLSHLGLETPQERWDDRRIAAELQDDVDVIIGAHSHDLLPNGEWVGRVLIAQAGEFGEHLGRIEVDGKDLTASVEPVAADVEQHGDVLDEAQRIEDEVRVVLDEPLGVLGETLDAAWIADMLRRRMGADVGVFAEGLTIATLPPGPLTRGELWEASETPANPGVTTMTGEQLLELVRRGNDPAFAAETPRPLRGRARGLLRLAGLTEEQIAPTRTYVVAGSDWELDSYAGYAAAAWELAVRYDFPIIIREAIEEDLRGTH
jgi:2',3'-cyclic-nucleotide 2'-phosphodiesterase (5'-nucleotidase family)